MIDKIGIFSDHGGFALKEQILNTPMPYTFADYGTYSSESVDYPQYAYNAALMIKEQVIHRAVLICGTGIGICMAANRNVYVRAFVGHTAIETQLARAHNNANVICFSGRYQCIEDVIPLLKIFMETPFEGGRHSTRIQQFSND